jgi:transitional endoplasmic reticulum ATPase
MDATKTGLHQHGHGAPHVHASVDHLASGQIASPNYFVALDPELAKKLDLAEDGLIRIDTDLGRSILGRYRLENAPERGSGVIKLDRFARQSLKAHLNGSVEIAKFDGRAATKVVLRPAIDVSMAHDLSPHIKSVLVSCKTPVAAGTTLYIRFPGSHAGTTYEVAPMAEGPGVVTDASEVTIDYVDSHLPEGVFDITYEDVGGLGVQITTVRELVQLPLRYPHVYRQLGISPPRGIILFGPPGSGKTHLARAVANEVDARFYYINGPDVIGTYTGETEANLRRMFSEASHHAPSIIFIDELDAIAPRRGETGAHADTRTVTQLLSLMDGLKRVDSVVVIATTNRVDSVDPAFRRPGRFDREIFIGPPDAAGRREVLGVHTREMPLSDGAMSCLDDVAKRAHGFLGADLMELCREAGLNAMRRHTLALSDHRAAFQLPAEEIMVEADDFAAALSRVRPSALRETLISIPDVGWADVGGLDDVKRQLMEAVEMPLRNPALLSAYGLSPRLGILLYGPPGSGKTMLAKALANECGLNFIAVNGSEMFTKWLGESEEGVRQVFRVARQVAPTVLFFDQLESIAPIRGKHEGSMTTERVVSQLLTELDGIESHSKVIVVAATNRIDLIDPSILRSGRFGLQIHVPSPDRTAREEIIRNGLRIEGLPENPAMADILAMLVQTSEGMSAADLQEVCDKAKLAALRRGEFERLEHPLLGDLQHALQGRGNAVAER